MKSNRLIAFAQDFVSFLIQNSGYLDEIRNIILFGSAARGDFSKESDVDIFIDTKNKKINVDKITSDFYKSQKFNRYWKLLGIENAINCKIGDIDKWDLKRSIVSNGIILYGKYKSETKTRPYTLFKIDVKGNRTHKIKLWRKLYGYTQKVRGKDYPQEGLIRKYDGKKLSKATFIVPIDHTNKIKEFLNENKIDHILMDFWTDASV